MIDEFIVLEISKAIAMYMFLFDDILLLTRIKKAARKVNQSIHQPINQAVNQLNRKFICLSICRSSYQLICQSIRESIHQSSPQRISLKRSHLLNNPFLNHQNEPIYHVICLTRGTMQKVNKILKLQYMALKSPVKKF